MSEREYRPFEEARAFVHGLGLTSGAEWFKYCVGQMPEKGKKPEDIPAAPQAIYKDHGWISWGDWLGTGTIAPRLREYRPFAEARAFVHGLGLNGRAEWKKYCAGQMPEKGKKPEDIPVTPQVVYKDHGWISWGDWLGKLKT